MLRTRLLIGLMCLLVILLAMGLYSIDRCSQLGRHLQTIKRDNDEVGRSLWQMKRSGALMTGALLTLVAGDREESNRTFTAASKSFAEALDEQNSRRTPTDDEKQLIAKLDASYKAYSGRAQAFLRLADQQDPSWTLTAEKLGRDTGQILELVDQLALAHDQGVEEGNREAASDINSTIRALTLLMIVAMIVAIYAFTRMSRSVLGPVISLTDSIQEVGKGNLDQKVLIQSKDELGRLATSFNQMAAQLKQYRDSTVLKLTRLSMTIQATLASFPDPIFVLNSKGEVEFRNPEADEFAVKLLISGVTRLPKNVEDQVERVLATGQDYLPTLFKEAIKFNIDGQDRYFLPRIVLLRDNDNDREVFGVAVILEDVTRMLLLDDIKSNLISTVSHELKTPLTSVRMILYLLHEKTLGELSDKQADAVSTAREDADRLLKTLNDLLDMSKLEQGPGQLELTRLSAVDLVEAAQSNTRELANAAEITLKQEVASGLPDISVDRQRIDYVFSNLITNAIKYSPNGSEVLLRAERGQTRGGVASIRFSVKDQGMGISSEHQEHIFERFYRVPGTNKNGAGLGLFIAREIVAAHGGEIGVLSKPGVGSEFFFLLPSISDESASLI